MITQKQRFNQMLSIQICYNNIYMIKKNQNITRQKLLRKNSDDTVSQYPPFQIQECYSAVDRNQRDQSYYCLETQSVSNPYFVQLVDQPERKIQCKTKQSASDKYKPEKINMNGNCYQKINTQPEIKLVDQIKAMCGACRTMQLIPRNSTKFICYSCHTVCKCMRKQSLKKQQKESRPQTPLKPSPKNKIFICGVCSVKVSYPAGVSQYIKCSRCNTVNMVQK